MEFRDESRHRSPWRPLQRLDGRVSRARAAAPEGFVRVLAAQDRGGRAHPVGDRDASGAAAADVLLGDLRRRRLDAPAHARDRRAAEEGDRRRCRGSPHLRRRHPRRDRRDRARLLGCRHPPHRGAARRSAVRHGRQVQPPSRRLCQCRRADRRPEEDRRRSRSAPRAIPRSIPIRPTPRPTWRTSSARSMPAPTAASPSSSSRPTISCASATVPPRPA